MIEGYIYSLNDPKTNDIFYIGSTTISLKNRISIHIRSIKTGTTDNVIACRRAGNRNPNVQ